MASVWAHVGENHGKRETNWSLHLKKNTRGIMLVGASPFLYLGGGLLTHLFPLGLGAAKKRSLLGDGLRRQAAPFWQNWALPLSSAVAKVAGCRDGSFCSSLGLQKVVSPQVPVVRWPHAQARRTGQCGREPLETIWPPGPLVVDPELN